MVPLGLARYSMLQTIISIKSAFYSLRRATDEVAGNDEILKVQQKCQVSLNCLKNSDCVSVIAALSATGGDQLAGRAM